MTLVTILESIRLPEKSGEIRGHISPGETIARELTGQVHDLWTFNGRSGQFATITLSPADTSIDLTLTLFDSVGQLLESTDSGFAGDQEVITDAHTEKMTISSSSDGVLVYKGNIVCQYAGRYGFSLRVVPGHYALPHRLIPGLVVWA